MLIKPVQRITRYKLLLEQIMHHSRTHTEAMQDALNVVVSIPRVANDQMHLKSFEDAQVGGRTPPTPPQTHQIGEFLLQDPFVVSEPKRMFKRGEKEMQVFLFESCIVFTKREELPNKKIRYVYKNKYMVRVRCCRPGPPR